MLLIKTKFKKNIGKCNFQYSDNLTLAKLIIFHKIKLILYNIKTIFFIYQALEKRKHLDFVGNLKKN